MQFEKIAERIVYLDELITKEATGTPIELAKRFGISRRVVFNYLQHLKETKSKDIIYCKIRKSYKYKE